MDSNLTTLPSFQDLFSKLISKLKDRGKIEDVSNHFTPSHSLEHMFSHLWNLDEAQSCLIPITVISEKSEGEAEILRVEGNGYYKEKLLEKALSFYNQSIMYAPHPDLPTARGNSEKTKDEDIPVDGSADYCDKSSERLYKSLALGFANRSAVLYELKQYGNCVRDLEMAFSYGYPKILHCKLAERKAKCLIAQRRKAEAVQVIDTALEDLSLLPLDETKKKSSREALQRLCQQCKDQSLHEDSLNTSDCKPPSLSLSATGMLHNFETPKPPTLPHPNASIPSLSSAVQLAFSPSQGRYLVAEKDIKPGEVLVVEEGYSRVLQLDSHLKTHCSGCLARCPTPLPCPHCPMVIFCSSECRVRALASYHVRECTTLASLTALDIGKNAVLAYRILMQTTFTRLKELVPIFQKEASSQPAEKLGFNDKGLYDSSDYRTTFHLVANKESRSVSDLFKRCAMTVVLLKLLDKSRQFFVDTDGAVFTPSQEDVLLSGLTLFTHMMNLPCNAHSITELQVDDCNYQHSSSQEIGCGAFSVLSLTNHSCNPAAARVSYGSVVVLRAIRHITAGTELTDCYGEHYAISSPEDRKNSLLYQYYFTCLCDPCQNHWPTYINLSSRLVLRCLICCVPLDCAKDECPRCHQSYSDRVVGQHLTDRSYNWREVEEQIRLMVKKYDHSYSDILKGNNSVENRNIVCEVIELLDKYVMLPCKTYFEAQETLKHCFDRLGSCSSMNDLHSY